jgi:hypothetical protein
MPALRFPYEKPVVTPQVNVSAEQYNGIVLQVTRGIPVQLEVRLCSHSLRTESNHRWDSHAQ